MTKLTSILIVSTKGQLLMQLASSQVTAFAGPIAPGETAIKAAVRTLRETTGLDVRADDLEFLDTYINEDAEIQTFILAGLDEDRVYVYGGGELHAIKRSDDFAASNLSGIARKQAIDYFKRHKKW